MEYFNNILTVEAGWMIEQGVMTDCNYRHLTTRGDIQVVRRACRNTPALVAYDSLPDRYKKAIAEKVGDPRQAARKNVLEGLVEHSTEAAQWFEGFMIDTDRHLPKDKREEYYANAMVLDAIGRLILSRTTKRKALGGKATRFWEEISQAVQCLDRGQWPHTLPENARSLERKYQKYRSEGYASLVHKAYTTGQRNAAKVATEENEAILVSLMADPRNLDNAQVAKLYNMVAAQMGWKKITSATVAVWRDKCDDLIYSYRRGREQYRANREMQVRRSAPTRPLLFWTLDGWDVELLYQERNAKGVVTYTNRLTLEVVLDACTKYPIGFAIGKNEDSNLIREALRDAERETQRLFGKMYRATQIQSDHFALKAMSATYEAVASKVIPARVKNAKSKPVEPWFNYFNKKYCQLQANWCGFGVTSKKDLQPNMEALSARKKDFPDKEGVIKQLVTFIQMERAELREQYVASFSADGLEELTTQQYLMAFGQSTGDRRYLLQGSGIKATIGTAKMDYDCFDTRFRKYASIRWQLRYDPEDPHYAVAVNEDETLQFVLEEKHLQPMALADRTEGDAAELKRVMDFNRRKEQEIIDHMGRTRQTAMEVLEQATLSKLLITDSQGQHKLPKAKARLKAAQPEYAEVLDDDEFTFDMY